MNEHQPTKRSEPDSTRPNIVLIVTDQHRRNHLGRLDERFCHPTWNRLAEGDGLQTRCRSEPDLYAESCNPCDRSSAVGPRHSGLTSFTRRSRNHVHAVPGRRRLPHRPHRQAPFAEHGRPSRDRSSSRRPHTSQRRRFDTSDGLGLAELKLATTTPKRTRHRAGLVRSSNTPSLRLITSRRRRTLCAWLRDQGVDPWHCADGRTLATDETWSEIRQPAVETDLYHSAWVGKRSAAFAEGRPRPYFIQVSFPDPHHPFTPPSDRYHRYDHRNLEPPKAFTTRTSHRCPPTAADRERPSRISSVCLCSVGRAIPAGARSRDATIELMTKQSEKSWLQSSTPANTIVIFTSDHGDMFGDHGLMLKTAMHYRAVLEVPLFIAGPGITQGRSHSLVSTLDLAQTICALADVEPFWGMQGHYLTPILREPGTGPRSRAHRRGSSLILPVSANHCGCARS